MSKPKITVISATERPMDVIGIVAGTSYGKNDPSEKRVLRCWRDEHMSVFEHASVTVRIEGVSRALTHQLVRHRLASYCQQSQRYVKLRASEMSDWFVMPPSFVRKGLQDDFRDKVTIALLAYQGYMEAGIPAEDARYVLPEGCKTMVSMTMNARELFSFLDLRTDEHAQWEIRHMSYALIDAVRGISPQWRYIMELWRTCREIPEGEED